MAGSNDNVREKFHKLTNSPKSVNGDERTTDWEAVISIGTAAKIVNLSVSALRKYEKEGLLIFHRSESGRRLLCRADIKRIEMIKHMIGDIGLNLEGIRRLLALLPCWDLRLCPKKEQKKCEAISNNVKPCWMIESTWCRRQELDCRQCEVYRYGAYCAVTMKLLLRHTDNKG